MGERGPAKTPTALKLLRGERKESRLNRSAPAPARRFPTMPAELSAGAARAWRIVRRDFEATGVITAVDAPILRAYCEAVDRYSVAAKALADAGPIIRGARRGDLIKNPLHQIVRDNAVLVVKLGRELGLTPAAREALHSGAEGSIDPLESWLAHGTG